MSQKSDIEERRRQQAEDAMAVCSSPHGRRFLAWLVEEVGMYREVFNEAPRRSAFDEGRKSVGFLLRRVAMATGISHWTAIEEEIQKRKIEPTNRPKETENE